MPDLLSRIYQDDQLEAAEIAAVVMAEQTSDPWYKKLFEKVAKDPTDHPWYKIIGGRLYEYRSDPSIENLVEDQDAWKLLVPIEQRPTVLAECHDEPVSSHFGRRKTYERIARYYYWPTIYRDVANFVRKCEVCQQIKVPQLLPAGLMGRRVIRRPWASISEDAMGPYPRTAKGNIYLLVFTDTLKKWVEFLYV